MRSHRIIIRPPRPPTKPAFAWLKLECHRRWHAVTDQRFAPTRLLLLPLPCLPPCVNAYLPCCTNAPCDGIAAAVDRQQRFVAIAIGMCALCMLRRHVRWFCPFHTARDTRHTGRRHANAHQGTRKIRRHTTCAWFHIEIKSKTLRACAFLPAFCVRYVNFCARCWLCLGFRAKTDRAEVGIEFVDVLLCFRLTYVSHDIFYPNVCEYFHQGILHKNAIAYINQ